MNLAGRRFLVVGLGVSGFAVARALLEQGATVGVTEASSNTVIEGRARVLRAAGASVETGRHDLVRLEADAAIVSPGIPPASPVVLALKERGTPMIGEIELAWRLQQGTDFLAVTGTNGKTTTTSLLAAILEAAGIPSAAAGNIGTPLIEVVRALPEGAAVAVEVSSFQLEAVEEFRPRVAVLLNIAEDHTDWHGSFDAYLEAKARVTRNQRPEDVLVVNAEDEHAMSVATRSAARVVPFAAVFAPSAGIGVEGERVLWRGRMVMSTTEVALPGVAGLQDALAASAAALEYGVEPEVVSESVRAFVPLSHRLEVVAERAGVTFIDDSKATNPHATLSATRGLKDVVLIAGGRAKGIDLSVLAATVPPVRAVVTLGESAPDLEKVFDDLVPTERANSMREAVALARKHSAPGGSVLLSPACASLDMYESYAARGQDFARAVAAELSQKEER